ncbi:TonB-dependent receptor [Gilvimarinus chinensis]|uniref:TonB-dependent receptor n=1 Tax=Gilvimarinus chinensis TaxID=396005 RepID=UPI0003756F8C|nr:TonB-dependent receptor [Gilvimarinus chinensis]
MESNKGTFRRKVLASSISSCLLASAYMAQAQESEPMLEEVVVTGVYASQQNAINTKRDATSVVDAISAEDIGKLPDVTISDSLQRIPGIQVERTAGEGGPVQIRGLSNVGTMLNGEVFLSATTIDASSADFGDLPSQLFSGAEVYKSPRADVSAQGISGVIDLQTRRPFDLDEGWTFSAGAEVDHGSISDEYDPTVNGLIAYNAEDWGILVSAVTTEKNLATDFNGYFDTSENGGIGATNSNHTWSTPAVNPNTYHLVPQGFAAFHKEEERQRDGANVSFQAQLTDGVELVADYFYSEQDRFNRRAGFSHNNRWQTFTGYAFETEAGLLGNEFTFIPNEGTPEEGAPQSWNTINAFYANPYRLQSFSQVNRNTEKSENASVELNFDNGGPLTGQVRVTRATASASMRHGYVEGDMLSIDQGTLVTGPGGLVPGKYCDGTNHIPGSSMGDDGGCYIQYAPGGIEDDEFLIKYDASGEHPVFSGFDQIVDGGQGQMTVAEYMASIDSYHVGAMSSENNTDDEGEINTFSTRWNYEFDDTAFITSVDFGVRQSERSVDHDVFSYFGTFPDTGCMAQWKAVDQFANTPDCDMSLQQGEMVDGEFVPYTLLMPTRIDEHNDVVWIDDFGPVEGIPGVWTVDPKALDDTLAYQTQVFGEQTKFVQPGQSYKVGLDEFSYFGNVNFAVGDLSGNLGVKVVETDLTVVQNVTGDAVPHSGVSYDAGDVVTERGYTDVLPSLNLSYHLADDLILRASYGKTMQPLDLLTWGGAKSVGRVFNEDCNCMRVTGGNLNGNPTLDPTRAENMDLAIEWYLGSASMVGASLFDIEIDSFVQTGTTYLDEPDADGINRGPWPFQGPTQGTGGSVTGVELQAKVAFSDITDGFMSNFGFDVNYTYSDSSQEAEGVNGELPFINNSEDTYNVVGWFENDVLAARLAYNFRSPRLIAQGNDATGSQALYQDDYGQLDMNVTWYVTENIDLYVNGSNIMEEYQQTYVEFSDQKAFQNIYEARWALGARVNF